MDGGVGGGNRLNVDQYFREALRIPQPAKKPKLPKPPRHPVIYDFQFYPRKLKALLEREMRAYQVRPSALGGGGGGGGDRA